MSIMQLVKKKKGKKRPGYRGDDAYGGGTTAGGSRADSPGDRGDGPATGGGGGQQPSVDVGFQNALRNQRRRKEEITKSQDPNFGQFFGSRVPTFQKPTIGQRLGGLGSTIFGGLLSLINPALGLAFRGINFMKNKAPETFQNFKSSNTLEEFRDKMRGYGRTMPDISNNPAFGGIESLGVFDDEEEDMITPMSRPDIFNYNNSVGRFDPNANVNTNNITGASQNMVDADQMSNFFNNQQFMNGGIVDLVDIYD